MTLPRKNFWFQSIQITVSIALFLTTTVTMTGMMFYSYKTAETKMLSDLHHLANFISHTLSESLTIPMWFVDRPETEAIIEAVMGEKNIFAIVVKDHNDNFHIGRMRNPHWQSVDYDQAAFGNGYISSQKRILKNEIKVGNVEVFLTNRFMRQQLNDSLQEMMIAYIILTILLFITIYLILQRIIIAPILSSAKYLRRIAVGDIPEKIANKYRGEFDEIRESLNTLIEANDQTILIAEKIANGSLSVGVAERSKQDRLMKALNAMIRRMNRLMRETDNMLQHIRQGRLDIRGNTDAFRGGWRKLVEGINELTADLGAAIQRQVKEKETAERYFDTAAVMLLVLDTDGKVAKINKRGLDILGYTEKEVIGKDWFEHFIPDHFREGVKKKFGRFVGGKKYYEPNKSFTGNENCVLTRSGEERIVLWNTACLTDESGHIIGILSSGEDITERRRAEEEQKKLSAQLRHLHKMEAIGTLAGGIAHDFNNILCPIIGYAEMAMDIMPKDSRVYEYVQQIFQGSKRASELVRQILTFARSSEHEHLPLKIQPIIKEALKLLRATLPSTIEIIKNIDEECEAVMGDPTQIHQIIMNLCTNAYHAIYETGGVLEVRLETIENGKNIRLTVSDTGVGMESNVLDRIFEPYFTTRQNQGGTGLGLAVVHGIVKQMNGHISVFSRPGEGTKFHIDLPIVRTEISDEEIISDDPLIGGTEKILLIDDEEVIVRMMKDMLESLSYEVFSCTGTVEALSLLQQNPYDFDLVITDMTLPEMTGLALSQKILAIRPDIPIILCTGFSEPAAKQKAKELGIREFMIKPLSRREITQAIRRALSDD